MTDRQFTEEPCTLCGEPIPLGYPGTVLCETCTKRQREATANLPPVIEIDGDADDPFANVVWEHHKGGESE